MNNISTHQSVLFIFILLSEFFFFGHEKWPADIAIKEIESIEENNPYECFEVLPGSSKKLEKSTLIFRDTTYPESTINFDYLPDTLSRKTGFIGSSFNRLLEDLLNDSKPIKDIKPLLNDILESYSHEEFLNHIDNDNKLLSLNDKVYLTLKRHNLLKKNYLDYQENKLIVTVNSGLKKVFNTEISEDNDTIYYSFEKHIPEINHIILSKNLKNNGYTIDDESYVLVNLDNGATTKIWDLPSISPKGDLMVVASFGWWEALYTRTKGFQIFQIKDNSISPLGEIEVCHIEPSVVGWLDNNKVLINTYNDGEEILEMLIQVNE